MTDKLTGGKGIGSSLRETLSEKTKAKMTGIKETFDPMNIVKTMTFGSKLGPALYGKMMGRSKEDMKYFTDKKTRGPGKNKTPGQIDSQADSMAVDALGLIYRLMLRNQEEEKTRIEESKGSIEERDSEEELRNRELVKALTGRRKKEKPFRDEKGRFAKRPTEEKPKPEPTKETPKKGGKKEEAPKPTKEKPKAEKVPTTKETPKPSEKVPTKEAPPAPKPTPEKAPTPTAAPKPTAGKISTGAAVAGGLSGKAAMVAAAVGSLGITNAYAKQAIVATSAKESGLDPKSKEDGASAYLKTLKNRGIDYIHKVFPQLKPGGRVAKQLNMPNGVPAEYLQSEWSKGDEAFFSMVYDGLSTNSQPGDGYKYRGRGLIGITGRSVYKNVGNVIGIDLESNPDALTQDFDTAAKAAAAYLAMTMGGKGGPKKGFEIMNSFQDPDTALKSTLRAVAGYGHKEEEFNKEGSHLHEQYRKASQYMNIDSSGSTGSKIDEASKENKDLKESLNKDKPKQSTVNNTTVSAENKETKQSTETVDDRPAHLKKKG